MTEDRTPSEQSSRDRIVDEVTAKVEQRPAVDAPREEVEARAEQAVDGLIERPVQTFTPLLAENEVVGGLLAEKHDSQEDQDPGTGEQSEDGPS